MDTNEIATGGCYCGAVRFEVVHPFKSVINCHCNMCRSLSGAAYTTWVSVPAEQFRYRQGESQLSAYTVSSHVAKRFCPICGTAVSYTDARYPDIVGIPAGIIRPPLCQAPTAHYFVGDKAAWTHICDGLPQFGGESGFEPLFPTTANAT
ncbi:MAG TPA: GFA family protein [Gammaproteobacteria bacterium]